MSDEQYDSGHQSGSPQIFTEEDPTQPKHSLTELRTALAVSRDKAAAAVQKSIRTVGLVDELGNDVRSGLLQALEDAAAELRNIDPMAVTDPEVLLEAAQRIEVISKNR